MLPVNTLLKERDTGVVFRVLDEVASAETKDLTPTHYVLIDIHDPKAMPVLVGKRTTLARVVATELVVVEEEVPGVSLEHLTAYDTRLVERRWRLVSAVRSFGQRVWDDKFRGRLVRRLLHFRVCSKPYFYDTLRLYWQRGQTKEAVVTDMWRCGAPGELRISAKGAPKPGRPRTIQPGVGVAATEEHRRNMRLAWSSAPVGRDGRYLKQAWHWMLIAHYGEHARFVPKGRDKHEVVVDNYDRVPTFEQFQYHWKVEHPFDVRMLSRMRKRRFDLAFKPLLSGTLPEMRGPGTRYYIDATILDVYAVSRLNPRRLVGRPTLYVVVDGFSRMVVGIYVGLEPPCWAGAMLALWNCSVDKVAFCAQYGISITSDMWPTGHMPLNLMADRGEMMSHEVRRLAEGFGIDVENSRAYAGEAKGVVERVFRTLHAIFGPFLPGYIDKEVEGRGEFPAKLKSAMTIEAITRAVINAVLTANLRVVREYDGWPEVIADGTPFVPVSLWNWGVENLRADIRSFADLHLKKYLWPEVEMRVTRRGLQMYRGLYYMGEAHRQQSWFAEALHRKQVVRALFHPLSTDSAIALPSSARGEAFELTLARRSAKLGGVSFSELAALESQKNTQNALAAWTNLPTQLAAYHRTIEDAAQSRRAAEKAKPAGETRAERLRGIKDNRDAELKWMTQEVVNSAPPPSVVPPSPMPAVAAPESPPAPTPAPEESAEARTADIVRNMFIKRRNPPPTP